MYHLLHLCLFALSVSARCTRRQSPGQQEGKEAVQESSGDLGVGLNGLAALPANSTQSNSAQASPIQEAPAQVSSVKASSTQVSSAQSSSTQASSAQSSSAQATPAQGAPTQETPGDLTVGLDGLAQLPPGSGQNGTQDTGTTDTGASGCPPLMKAVAFNSGMNPGMYDKIGAADNWLTFSPSVPGGPASTHATAGFVPMMAFASDVQQAIDMVTSDSAPEWMLTFNEPDFSYMGLTPMMSGAEAATAIAPLIEAAKGKKTKFVAPVTADPNSAFHEEFFAACNCKDFFSAYNIHHYSPSSAGAISSMQAYHAKWSDKPLWLTEIAPGGSGCTTSWEEAGQYMRDIYKFAKGSGFVDRVFWNTGNQIDPNDQNVCNSYLLDMQGNPSPLLDMYKAVDCS